MSTHNVKENEKKQRKVVLLTQLIGENGGKNKNSINFIKDIGSFLVNLNLIYLNFGTIILLPKKKKKMQSKFSNTGPFVY
jgi:hypothetical protein